MGGAFPVGEVISESVCLEEVSGEVQIWGFPTVEKVIQTFKEPIKLRIERGRVADVGSLVGRRAGFHRSCGRCWK